MAVASGDMTIRSSGSWSSRYGVRMRQVGVEDEELLDEDHGRTFQVPAASSREPRHWLVAMT